MYLAILSHLSSTIIAEDGILSAAAISSQDNSVGSVVHKEIVLACIDKT